MYLKKDQSHFLMQKLRMHSGGRGRRISEFEASLVYRARSRTVKATQRNLVLKKKIHSFPDLHVTTHSTKG